MTYIENRQPLRQREPRVRDKAYMGWIAGLPCLACYCRGGFFTSGVHVAHVRMPSPEDGWREVGKSEKPSDKPRTVPLCPHHHLDGPTAQHRIGERTFYKMIDVWPPALCAELVRAYDAGESGSAVIRRASQGAFPFPDHG